MTRRGRAVRDEPLPSESSTLILVVDDDESVRITLAAVLREEGYTVRSAGSGARAIAWLKRTEFDVVITDLRLGEVDGVDVLKESRRRWPDTVVLMLTGYASVESAIDSLRNGAYDYLCKPCPAEELLATVRRAVERRSLTLQVRQQTRSLETAIDTARDLFSAASARAEGTAALLREREHVLVNVCTELRTSLAATGGLIDRALARIAERAEVQDYSRDAAADQELRAYFEAIRSESRGLAQRVNAAVLVTSSESVEMCEPMLPAELRALSFQSSTGQSVPA